MPCDWTVPTVQPVSKTYTFPEGNDSYRVENTIQAAKALGLRVISTEEWNPCTEETTYQVVVFYPSRAS